LIAIIPNVLYAASGQDIYAQKEEWILIDKGEQSLYIDKKSIRRSTRIPGKTIFRVWGKVVYKEPKPYKSKHLKNSSRYYEWFCNDKMFRVLQEINNFTDGTYEIREDLEIRDWKELNTNMLENVIYDRICR
jgi:hypothetical protein